MLRRQVSARIWPLRVHGMLLEPIYYSTYMLLACVSLHLHPLQMLPSNV
jgi:hypothetical protein